MSDRRQGRLTAGVILIVIGLAFFIGQRYDIFEIEYFFLILGLAFLVAYFLQKKYGYLVPGGILTGIGLGETLDRSVTSFGDADQIFLGLGFVMIYVIALAYQKSSHWWPLIPGGILILTGIDRIDEVADYFFDNWPLVLVLVGIFLIVGGLRTKRSES